MDVEEKRQSKIEIPASLAKFPESAVLYPKLLLRAKPEPLRRFGIDDLTFRLECQTERECRAGTQPDLLKRAAIWYLIAAKCSDGTSEVASPTKDALRDWMPGAEAVRTKTVGATCATCGKKMRVQHNSKFASCRDCRGARNRREAATREMERTGTLPEGWKVCVVCAGPFKPKRADAVYCPKAECRKKAYRERRDAAESQRNRDRQAGVLAELG